MTKERTLMKYTICPPGPEPKRYTASCPQMGRLLMGGDDLTIDFKRRDLVRPQPLTDKPFEDKLLEMLERFPKGEKS